MSGRTSFGPVTEENRGQSIPTQRFKALEDGCPLFGFLILKSVLPSVETTRWYLPMNLPFRESSQFLKPVPRNREESFIRMTAASAGSVGLSLHGFTIVR
jgi:hypothetical protein